ncbi:MAG: hypothetical protein WAT79_03635 [Saprospiraceae bacterium]
MRIEHYTPFLSSKKNIHGIFTVSKQAESMVLYFLAVIGIAGTIFLITNRPSIQNSGPSLPEYGAVSAFLTNMETESQLSSDFNKYIKMDSKAKVGQEVTINFLEDEKASRYVMDMGDGVRLVVTQKNLMYVYEKPGKYTIELKEIQRGILHLRGTKVIKVKE